MIAKILHWFGKHDWTPCVKIALNMRTDTYITLKTCRLCEMKRTGSLPRLA